MYVSNCKQDIDTKQNYFRSIVDLQVVSQGEMLCVVRLFAFAEITGRLFFRKY